MANQPALSILVPCLHSRPWKDLVTELWRQADEVERGIEILYEVDGGEQTSGVKRQTLLDRARGEYVAYFDDDDWPRPNYMEELAMHCDLGIDVVSFDLQISLPPGKREEERYRNMEGEVWSFRFGPNHRAEGLMTVNHLCAWRRELSEMVPWCPHIGTGDVDLKYQAMYHGLKERDILEYHVDEVLYEYHYDPDSSENQRPTVMDVSREYFGPNGLRVYEKEGEILTECRVSNPPAGCIAVRDSENRVRLISKQNLKHLTTVKLAL